MAMARTMALSNEEPLLAHPATQHIRPQLERLGGAADAAAAWKEFHALNDLYGPEAIAAVPDMLLKHRVAEEVLAAVVRHLRRHPASKVGSGCRAGPEQRARHLFGQPG